MENQRWVNVLRWRWSHASLWGWKNKIKRGPSTESRVRKRVKTRMASRNNSYGNQVYKLHYKPVSPHEKPCKKMVSFKRARKRVQIQSCFGNFLPLPISLRALLFHLCNIKTIYQNISLLGNMKLIKVIWDIYKLPSQNTSFMINFFFTLISLI